MQSERVVDLSPTIARRNVDTRVMSLGSTPFLPDRSSTAAEAGPTRGSPGKDNIHYSIKGTTNGLPCREDIPCSEGEDHVGAASKYLARLVQFIGAVMRSPQLIVVEKGRLRWGGKPSCQFSVPWPGSGCPCSVLESAPVNGIDSASRSLESS